MLTYRKFLATEAGPGMDQHFAKAVNAAIELASPLVSVLPAPVLTDLELVLVEPYLATKPSQVTLEGMAASMNKARSVAAEMVEVAITMYRTDTTVFQGDPRLNEWRKALDDYHWRCVVEAIYAACIIEDPNTHETLQTSAQKIADGNMGLIVRNYEDTLFDEENFRKRYIIVRRIIHDAARQFLKTVA